MGSRVSIKSLGNAKFFVSGNNLLKISELFSRVALAMQKSFRTEPWEDPI